MATQLEIINLALGHLAVATITSTNEASVAAQAAVRVWDHARKECLRGHDWSFGTVVATLTLSASYATLTTSGLYGGGYIYAYQYPSNCLAMWKIYNETNDDKNISDGFRELYDPANAARVIVSNTLDALCEYTFDVTDPQFFDASFVKVLSYKLASELAMPLTGDKDLSESMMKIFTALMSDAERMSALENNPDELREGSSVFIKARGGSEDTLDHFDPNNTHPND